MVILVFVLDLAQLIDFACLIDFRLVSLALRPRHHRALSFAARLAGLSTLYTTAKSNQGPLTSPLFTAARDFDNPFRFCSLTLFRYHSVSPLSYS